MRLIGRTDRSPDVQPDAAGPTFAILADPDEEVVDWALRHRRPGQAGAVFAIGMDAASRERFADAGWLCVDVDVRDDVRDAWRATEAGYIRGAH